MSAAKPVSKKKRRAEVDNVLKNVAQWTQQRLIEELNNAVVRCANFIWSDWLARMLRSEDKPDFDTLLLTVCTKRPAMNLRIVGDRVYFYRDDDTVYVDFLHWHSDVVMRELGFRVSHALLNESWWLDVQVLVRENKLEYTGFILDDQLPSQAFQDACVDTLLDWFAVCSGTPEYANRVEKILNDPDLKGRWLTKIRSASSSSSPTTAAPSPGPSST